MSQHFAPLASPPRLHRQPRICLGGENTHSPAGKPPTQSSLPECPPSLPHCSVCGLCRRFRPSIRLGLSVTVEPAILPLQRLKVLQILASAPARGCPVPDLPAQFAVGVPVALSPNERSVRVQPQRWMVLADRCLSPYRFDGFCIELPVQYCCVCLLYHSVTTRSTAWPAARWRLRYYYCPGSGPGPLLHPSADRCLF